MNTTLTQLDVSSRPAALNQSASGIHLDGGWDCAERSRTGVPTGNAAYWATLRPVQSTRLSRQGWKTLLDVLRNPNSR